MATIKTSYGTNNQTITCTVASLTSTSVRSSAAIDNTTNLYLDAVVQVQIKTAAAATSTSGIINVYAYGTTDGGTTYPEGAGADGLITLTVPTNLILIGQLNCVANSTTYKSNPMSVAVAFGGVLPALWGIVIENLTGATLDAAGGNHKTIYQGILATSA